MITPPPRKIPSELRSNLETASFFSRLVDSLFSVFSAIPNALTSEDIEIVQTTDGTQTTLHTIALEDEHTYQITATIIAVRPDGSDRAAYQRLGLFYRTGGGNATQEGSTVLRFTRESVSGWDVVFDVDGNDVRIRVTGTNTVDWDGITQYVKA